MTPSDPFLLLCEGVTGLSMKCTARCNGSNPETFPQLPSSAVNSPLGSIFSCLLDFSIYHHLPSQPLPVGFQIYKPLLFVLVFVLGCFLNPNTVQQNCIYRGLSELIP